MATRAYPQPAPLELALSVLPSLSRPLLARLVARMIDRMDEIDGDQDLEPDDEPEEDDHSGGAVDDEGEANFEGRVPLYAVDQSCGPVNGWPS